MTRYFGFFVFAWWAALPVGAAAQTTTPGANSQLSKLPVAAASNDTLPNYDSNSLRVESRGQALTIFRGINGPVVAETGIFHSLDLTRVVAPSENAIREAREFNRNYGPGMLATAIGGLLVGVAFAFDINSDPNWAITAGEVTGAALAIYGSRRLDISYRALSKSIWWYNRDLRK